MKAFAQVPFASSNHQPGDRQSALAKNQADHQGNTPMPDFTSVDNENQFTDTGQMVQQLAHKGQVIAFIIDPFILDPATVALDPAVRFRLIRGLSGYGRQLATLSQYNAADHRCQCGQHACLVAFRFAWKQLPHGCSDGTIYTTIVTHRFTPVLPQREKHSVPDVAIVIC